MGLDAGARFVQPLRCHHAANEGGDGCVVRRHLVAGPRRAPARRASYGHRELGRSSARFFIHVMQYNITYGARAQAFYNIGRGLPDTARLKPTPDSLPSHLEQHLLPAYLLSGDEPLLYREAADAIRARARRRRLHRRREVHFLERGSDWDDVRAAAGNLSLFGARRLLELRLPSGRPGVAGNNALRLLSSSATTLGHPGRSSSRARASIATSAGRAMVSGAGVSWRLGAGPARGGRQARGLAAGPLPAVAARGRRGGACPPRRAHGGEPPRRPSGVGR